MKNNNNTIFGFSSLLTVFAVLFLTILAVLTLETSQNSKNSTEDFAERTQAKYTATEQISE